MDEQSKESRVRAFIGPAGAEILSVNAEGVPIMANEDGVGEAREMSGVTFLGFTPEGSE